MLYHPGERRIRTKAQLGDNEQAYVVGKEFDQREEQENGNKGRWQWDIKTDITVWSEQLHRIVGRDPMTMLPSFRQHSCFYTPDSWAQLTAATLRLLKAGIPYELELQMLRPDGTRRRVIESGDAVRDLGGTILRLCGTVEDITEGNGRLHAVERQPEIVGDSGAEIGDSLIKAQEEENARIAKELRDNICQKMCLLATGIQRLPPLVTESGDHVDKHRDELWQCTSEIVDDLVRISNQLYPSTLELLGLPSAVRRLCREFANRTRIPIECSCTGIPAEEVEKEVALNLYRVLEEWLSNIANHNYVSDVTVELTARSKELLLRVSETGAFQEMRAEHLASGLRLVRIKERLHSIGGGFSVSVTPTGETRIEVRAPLSKSVQVIRSAGHDDYQ